MAAKKDKTEKVYQFPYDTILDADINDWLESLPRSRKAEMVRNAIRFYLQSKGISNNPMPIIPVTQTLPEEKEQKKRPGKDLNKIVD
jgi:hypothetical protein